jgi:hypothetical protein
MRSRMSSERAVSAGPGVDPVPGEQHGEPVVAGRGTRIRQLERGRCGERDGDPVRDERLAGRVARGTVVAHVARDRVGVRVRDVHPRVAEPHAGERRREGHVVAGLDVVAVADGGAERAGQQPDRLLAEDIRDGVGAAVRHPLLGSLAGVCGERPSGVRLQGVAEDVEPGRSRDPRGLGRREVGVDDRHRGPQRRVADPRLDLEREDVEDADRRALRPRPRRRRDGDERQQWPARRPPAPTGALR